MRLDFHFIIDGFPPKSDRRELVIKHLFDSLMAALGAELHLDKLETPLRLSDDLSLGSDLGPRRAVQYGYRYSASFESEDMELLFLLRNALSSWHAVVIRLVREHPTAGADYNLLCRPPQFDLKD